MGVNYSLFSDDHHETLTEYEYLDTIDIMLYGTFYFINHAPTDKKFFYKEFKIDKESSNITAETFFTRINKPLNCLIPIENGNIIEYEENYEGFILFEAFDFETNLANEIASKNGVHYLEDDLWKMLENTLNILEYMLTNGKTALTISPHHIYLHGDTYKLLDFEDLTELINNLDLTDSPILVYQSPHLISVLKDQEPIDINEKDNVFSLGMSILEAALLEHPLNVEEGDFSFDGLEEALSKVKYSMDFIEILKSMVDLNEDTRSDIRGLLFSINSRSHILTESPKSFHHKDELFGLGKSKINTGISLPVSHDYHFSGQNQIPPKPVKNLVLGGGIEEERNSQYIPQENARNSKKKSDPDEIYYLSSEVLPKSEFFKSIDSNMQPAKTFENYRVSIQSEISNNRPSENKNNEIIKDNRLTETFEKQKKNNLSGNFNYDYSSSINHNIRVEYESINNNNIKVSEQNFISNDYNRPSQIKNDSIEHIKKSSEPLYTPNKNYNDFSEKNYSPVYSNNKPLENSYGSIGNHNKPSENSYTPIEYNYRELGNPLTPIEHIYKPSELNYKPLNNNEITSERYTPILYNDRPSENKNIYENSYKSLNYNNKPIENYDVIINNDNKIYENKNSYKSLKFNEKPSENYKVISSSNENNKNNEDLKIYDKSETYTPMDYNDRPSENNKFFESRPSENIKKGGFSAEVNTMSPINSPFRISSVSQKPFEESHFIDYQTPEKLLQFNQNFAESDGKIHIIQSGSMWKNTIKIVYSPEKSAQKLKELDEEFQRKSVQIQEKKKSIDRSLNILRDACYFLKETRIPPLCYK